MPSPAALRIEAAARSYRFPSQEVLEEREKVARLTREIDAARESNRTLRRELNSLRLKYEVLCEQSPLANPARQAATIAKIAETIADKHKMPISYLFGDSRRAHIVAARQELYYYATGALPKLSIAAVSRLLGRDHSTMLWGITHHIERTGDRPLRDLKFDIVKKRAQARLRHARARVS